MTILLLVTLANGAMVMWAALRKVRRDRREAASSRRRADLRAALVGADDDVVDSIFNRARRDAGAQNDLIIVLGGIRVDEERRRRLVSAADRSGLSNALASQLTHRSGPARGRAVLATARLGGHLASSVLAARVADEDPDVRLVTVGALASLADEGAAHVLLDALLADRLPRERLIERLGASWALPHVLARLVDPAATALHRAAMADALRLCGDGRAEPALLVLLDVGTLEEQIAAAKALATCGSPRSHAAVLRALVSEHWQVRAQAAQTAGALGDVDAVPALEAALADQAWWVRARAAGALAELGLDGHDALTRAAAGPDRYAAERAAEMLGRKARQCT